jgi:hypothetical protein
MGHALVIAASLAAGAAGVIAPCPHPYFPMEEGLALTYRAGSSKLRVTFSDVHSDGPGRRALLHMEHDGKDGSTETVCNSEGVLSTGGLEGAALSMSGMDVKVVETRGVAMPPPARMTQGASWSNSLSIELRAPDKAKIPIGPVRTTFKKESTIEGPEKITIAGKTWDALRVRNKVTALAGTGAERTIESLMWLAPGVGILKIQTGNSVDLELTGVARLKRLEGANR